MKKLFVILLSAVTVNISAQSIIHPSVGAKSTPEGGAVSLTLATKHVNYPRCPQQYSDVYINSPKSANIQLVGRMLHCGVRHGVT